MRCKSQRLVAWLAGAVAQTLTPLWAEGLRYISSQKHLLLHEQMKFEGQKLEKQRKEQIF